MLVLRGNYIAWSDDHGSKRVELQLIDEHDNVIDTIKSSDSKPKKGPAAMIKGIRPIIAGPVAHQPIYYGDNIKTIPVGPITNTIVFVTSGAVLTYGAFRTGPTGDIRVTKFNSLTYPAPITADRLVAPPDDLQRQHLTPMLHVLALAQSPHIDKRTLSGLMAHAVKSEDPAPLDLNSLMGTPQQATAINFTADGTPSTDDNAIYDMVANVLTYAQCQIMLALNKNPGFSKANLQDHDVMLDYIRQNASGTLHYFNEQLVGLYTDKSMSTDGKHNTYSASTVNLGFLTDIFQSMAIPGDKLTELLGAVTSFTKSIQDLTASNSSSSATTAKLVVVSKLAHPGDDVTLNRTGNLSVMFIDFLEAAHEWSNFCGSGRNYELKTNVTTLELTLNRQVLIRTAPMFADWVLKNAQELMKPKTVDQGGNTVNIAT